MSKAVGISPEEKCTSEVPLRCAFGITEFQECDKPLHHTGAHEQRSGDAQPKPCEHPMDRRRGERDSIWCAVCGSCWYSDNPASFSEGKWHAPDIGRRSGAERHEETVSLDEVLKTRGLTREGLASAEVYPSRPGDPTVRHVVAWMRATYPMNQHAQEWAEEIDHVFLGAPRRERAPATCPKCGLTSNGCVCGLAPARCTIHNDGVLDMSRETDCDICKLVKASAAPNAGDDAELDSPSFKPLSLTELEARGFKRHGRKPWSGPGSFPEDPSATPTPSTTYRCPWKGSPDAVCVKERDHHGEHDFQPRAGLSSSPDQENRAFQAGWDDAVETMHRLLGERFTRPVKP